MKNLSYNSSVIALTSIERGSNIVTSDWCNWNSMIEHIGAATVFAFSSPSGSPISGSAELARLEFTAIGEARTKSAITIQGIIGNSDVEPIEASWVDLVVSVTPAVETKATIFFGFLSKGEFEESHELFNTDKAKALPVDALYATWNSVISNHLQR